MGSPRGALHWPRWSHRCPRQRWTYEFLRCRCESGRHPRRRPDYRFNIVIASSQISTGVSAKREVIGPSGIVIESVGTEGSVGVAAAVDIERIVPGGCVRTPLSVIMESHKTAGRIVVAGGIESEGSIAISRIGVTGGVQLERVSTGGRVERPFSVAKQRVINRWLY